MGSRNTHLAQIPTNQDEHRGNPLNVHTEFSEKLTFLTPRYPDVRVRIRGLEMLIFGKILQRT